MQRTLVVLLLMLFPCSLFAQEQATAKRRLKIGLALEGGGALGLAHIGVLEWFEKNHVPVDYVAGTSMGGLMGGMYAIGKSPAELRTLMLTVSKKWDGIIGPTPYGALSFRRKEDLRAYPNAIVLGLRGGTTLPAGLSAGHQISLIIDKETLPYSGIASFDELPIAFRCVATNLVTSDEKDFQDGPLADALRATMSLPGVFTPAKIGDAIYVDGGLVNNLPTNVVRRMGADIVIAVHLKTSTPEAKNIRSLVDVLGQTVDVVVTNNEKKGLEDADIVISADLAGYTLADYKAAETIMNRGLKAAEEKARLLETYRLPDTDWEEYRREREARVKTAAPTPQFVKVTGTYPDAVAQLERSLQNFAGRPLDTKKLEGALTRLTGVGKYDRAGYRIVQVDGREGLLVTVEETAYAPPMIQPGFEMDGSESGDVNFTLGARLTFMDMGGYRAEWRTDFLFGSTYGAHSEYYRPLTAGSRWFLAPEGAASISTFKIYQKNDPLAIYGVDRANIGASVGYAFNRFAEVRVGYDAGWLKSKLRIGTQQFPAVNGRTGAARLRFLFDGSDDPVIPRRGVQMETNFHWFDTSPGAAEAFPVMDARVGYFQPIAHPASLFAISSGGTTFGRQATGTPQFFLGGPERLGSYGLNELRGNQYFLFRGGYLHDLLLLPPFAGKRVFVIGEYELAKMYGFPTAAKLPNDFAAGIVAETVVGPLFFGGSIGDSGHKKWFFQLGRVF